MWTGGLPDGFDLDHLTKFIELWRPSSRFGSALDCGAHRGIWSREMAKHFREVIAFEANRDHYTHLVGQSDGTPNIFAYNMAVGEHHGHVGTAYHGVEGNTGACHVEGSGSTLMIKLDETSWPVDFLKLDVEGMELFALRGAEQKIAAYRPAIMVELNGNGKRFYGAEDQSVKDWLTERGYVCALKCNKDYFYVPGEISDDLGWKQNGY